MTKRESGAWNRAGRRSGGERTTALLGARLQTGDEYILGPLCALGEHALCTQVKEKHPSRCDCKCHANAGAAHG